MKIGLIGGGYVADMYMQTIPGHEILEIAGVWDRDPERLAAFSTFHSLRAYESLEEILGDDSIGLIVNLTNPRSHLEVSRAALEAGKHVYSEKPLGMTMDEAHELADLADSKGLVMAAAPCNHLSDVVDYAAKLLRDGAKTGRPLMVHAEMDDGLVPMMKPDTWRSISGAPWPVLDEFEVGCTIEHAGYHIAPLVELFGPVNRVTSFSRALLPDKILPYGGTVVSPDVSMGILEFDNGVIARLTNSIIAPSDRSLKVICEEGVLTLMDVWEYHSPLRFTPTGMSLPARLIRKAEHKLAGYTPGGALGRKLKVPFTKQVTKTQGGHRMDFARGVAQVAAQIERGAPVRMDAALAVHVTEVTLAIQNGGQGSTTEISSAAAMRAARA